MTDDPADIARPLDIRAGTIHYKLYAQDGTFVAMTVRDTPSMRKFVRWVRKHDRYGGETAPA